MKESLENAHDKSAENSLDSKGGKDDGKKVAKVPFYERLHTHVCKHARCAANNPHYAVKAATPPRKVLVAKKHTPGSHGSEGKSKSSSCDHDAVCTRSPLSSGGVKWKKLREYTLKTQKKQESTEEISTGPSSGTQSTIATSCDYSSAVNSAFSEEREGKMTTTVTRSDASSKHGRKNPVVGEDSCHGHNPEFAAIVGEEDKSLVVQDYVAEIPVDISSPTASVASNSIEYSSLKDVSHVLEVSQFNERSIGRLSLDSSDSSVSEEVSSMMQEEAKFVTSETLVTQERMDPHNSKQRRKNTTYNEGIAGQSRSETLAVSEDDDNSSASSRPTGPCLAFDPTNGEGKVADFEAANAEDLSMPFAVAKLKDKFTNGRGKVADLETSNAEHIFMHITQAKLKENPAGGSLPQLSLKESFVTKRFSSREPIQWDDDIQGSDTVSLRKGCMLDRKQTEEWMLDHAMEGAISNLPIDEGRVRVLVQAFESLVSLSEMDAVSRGEDHEDLQPAAMKAIEPSR